MRIAVLGAGNVGTHLARAFRLAGCEVSQVWSRTPYHAETLAREVEAQPVARVEELDTSAVDLFIVAVSDGAVAEVASRLCCGDTLVVHTAGSLPIDALSAAGSRYGVAWPVQSLVASQEVDYAAIPFCVEGCSAAVGEAIAEAVGRVSRHIFFLDGEQRRRAHLAAAMVSNFGNALNALVQDYLREQQLDLALLCPLIAATAAKTSSSNLWTLQTGPARRHDEATLAAHRALLQDDDDLRRLYDLMTRIIQNRCS